MSAVIPSPWPPPLPGVSTSETPTSAVASPTPTVTDITAPTNSTPPNYAIPDSSSGAQTGTILMVMIYTFFAILVAVGCYYLRSRRKKREATDPENNDSLNDPDSVENSTENPVMLEHDATTPYLFTSLSQATGRRANPLVDGMIEYPPPPLYSRETPKDHTFLEDHSKVWISEMAPSYHSDQLSERSNSPVVRDNILGNVDRYSATSISISEYARETNPSTANISDISPSQAAVQESH